jgi:ABC-type Na+ efflux pump permease subunit
VILDLGLVTAELFGLATAIFGAVTLVVEEMESKTIYLILTRPLPRPFYVLGRFLGLLLAVGASMALMEIVHFSLLFLKRVDAGPRCFRRASPDGLKSDGDDGPRPAVFAHFYFRPDGNGVFCSVLGARPFRERNPFHG